VPVQIPKKNFFEYFSSISWGPCTGTKCEKVVLFRFSAGTKCEKLNFYSSSNILNSLLVPVLNPKRTTFSHLVPVQRPQEIEEKYSKKFFLGICAGINPKTLFVGLKNF
jgi:hypothetical protein